PYPTLFRSALLSIVGGLDADVAGEQAHFAALVDPEGDLAEVHVLERTVERERVALNRSDRALLGLARIEVGRSEHDLVALAPARGVENLDTVAAGFGGPRQLAPGMLAIAVQAELAAHQHDAAVAHRVDVFAWELVGERDRGLAGVRLVLAADVELAAAQINPLGLEVHIAVVRKPELAIDG